MSNIAPPLPPPPRPQPPEKFDFVRPLAFVFDDPRWLPKVLLGGVFALASIVLIGIFFIYGYLARLVRNTVEGVQHPLPEWDDLGEFFSEGFRIFLITLIYGLPIAALVFAFIIPAIMMGSLDNESADQLSSGMVSCVFCMVFPIGLALTAWLPAALLRAVVHRNFSAAFQFGEIWRFISANLVNYVLAIAVWLVARFAASFVGLAMLCIGILFTQFWAMLVGGYAFGQVYKMSSVK